MINRHYFCTYDAIDKDGRTKGFFVLKDKSWFQKDPADIISDIEQAIKDKGYTNYVITSFYRVK